MNTIQRILATAACILQFTLPVLAQNANKISQENALQGNPSTEWDITGAGDLSIQGFATTISVNLDETVYFKIKTDANNYTIDIYRLGYYNGLGARKVGSGTITATLPQVQPNDQYDITTGKTDCSNWAVSAEWTVPDDAVSGVYLAKLTRADNSGSSHIVFIVRDDAANSALLFKTADATWQAYNNYGGNSLYVNSSGISIPGGFNHATKVSYNRPFYTRNGGGGGGASEDWLFNSEYPMIRFLEKNGYDLTYTTDADIDAGSASTITPAQHKVLLAVGHDEYWSAGQRAAFENARNAGVHLAFFDGNEVYWKTRWEDNHRTLVCYKEGTEGENVCGGNCDPMSGSWTGLWRAGCSKAGADGCKPENALTGQISWDGTVGAIQVPASFKTLRFWRNTEVASQPDNNVFSLPSETLGYEWDWYQPNGKYPAGRMALSATTIGGNKHQLSLYRHPNGALVFGAGTVQWAWGLDATHDRGNTPASSAMQQATVNLFADMGVQPATLSQGLVTAAASTDAQAPTSTISAPANNANLPVNTPLTITGTAVDAGDGVIAGVEFSVDNGVTWLPATGAATWTATFTPTVTGPLTIRVRSVDDSGNLQAVETSINITVTNTSVACPCSIWNPTVTPTIVSDGDNAAVEVGLKFKPIINGYITGIRFYKSAENTGEHIGNLWSSTGSNLGQATFQQESASGWQEVKFAQPVAVNKEETYVASYHTNAGHYSADNSYFAQQGYSGPNLYALGNGEDGANGVYKYASSSAFPTDTYQSTNYWVDVVFETEVGPDITPPVVTSSTPTNTAQAVAVNTAIVVRFNEPLMNGTVNSQTVVLKDSDGQPVSATVSYDNGTYAITIQPQQSLLNSSVYTVTIKGGTVDPAIKDVAGNALAGNYLISFTTAAVPPPPPSEGLGGPVLVVSSASNPFSRYTVELLRAEGINEFRAMDITQVTETMLNDYDVVILGEMPLNAAQVTLFTNWTQAGGTFIAFRPDAQLASLLGITSAGGTLQDKYLKVNTANGPGTGIVAETMQFHGVADRYNTSGATVLATLYSDANTATTYPAVTALPVGANGGMAVAFTYDLSRSIVYTRQGNPLWAGQKRDGQIEPRRSDDMFFPDWVDFDKIAIPQADEQQHLLSNIILTYAAHRKPLPKFWFLPKGLKAAIVMTGDDHGDAGMKPRFDLDITASPAGCKVDDWECIRSTGYLYVGSGFTSADANYYNNLGFEVALHVNTNCGNFNASEYQTFITSQASTFQAAFPQLPPLVSNRNHCIAFPDWSTVPEVEAANGIRLDVNYYYWPDTWVQNRPGMFTGSGMPMRFAKMDGTIIDCYQATTQMPDESGEVFPGFVDALLDKALGSEGYYGVFTTNMHFDNPNHPGANAIVSSAKTRGVPVVTAKQMLTWLDGRNTSNFENITWSGSTLAFHINAGDGARNLRAMLPVKSGNGVLQTIVGSNGPINFTPSTIKGIDYAFFDATNGDYTASYEADDAAPVITALTATPNLDGTVTVKWNTNEPADTKLNYGAQQSDLSENVANAAFSTTHEIVLEDLEPSTAYYYRVSATDLTGNTSIYPLAGNVPATFTTVPPPCASDKIIADFNAGDPGTGTLVTEAGGASVILKPVLNDDFSGTSLSPYGHLHLLTPVQQHLQAGK